MSRQVRRGRPTDRTYQCVNTLAFSPDGGTLVSGSWDDDLRLWDVASGDPVGRPLSGHTGDVFDVAFNPSGSVVASAGEDGTMRLWDVVHQS